MEEEHEIERLVMLRYVVFSGFTQDLYPFIYMILLRRVIGSVLAHTSVILDNKLSQNNDSDVLNAASDMMTQP
jgi:hypothetical protein